MSARLSLALPLLLAIAPPLAAQTEADLKRYFEGKRVTLKIDMPGLKGPEVQALYPNATSAR